MLGAKSSALSLKEHQVGWFTWDCCKRLCGCSVSSLAKVTAVELQAKNRLRINHNKPLLHSRKRGLRG